MKKKMSTSKGAKSMKMSAKAGAKKGGKMMPMGMAKKGSAAKKGGY